jgi:hypothetical protein
MITGLLVDHELILCWRTRLDQQLADRLWQMTTPSAVVYDRLPSQPVSQLRMWIDPTRGLGSRRLNAAADGTDRPDGKKTADEHKEDD